MYPLKKKKGIVEFLEIKILKDQYSFFLKNNRIHYISQFLSKDFDNELFNQGFLICIIIKSYVLIVISSIDKIFHGLIRYLDLNLVYIKNQLIISILT